MSAPANWSIDRAAGKPGLQFAIVAPFNDGFPGQALLGAFAYRPHAAIAAAAPDLLEACKLALRNVESRIYMASVNLGAHDRLILETQAARYRAAIAKAESGA